MASTNPFVLTFARLTLASVAVMHGLATGFGLFGGPSIEGFATKLSDTTNTGSGTLVPLWAALELLAGVCLLLGSFTRFASALALTLVIVLVVVDGRYTSFWVGKNGLEFPLTLAALCLVTLTSGPGACVFDVTAAWQRWRAKRKAKP